MNTKKIMKNLVFRDVKEDYKIKVKTKINRVAGMIEKRFSDVVMSERLKKKHFDWFVSERIAEYAESTQKDYKSTARLMILAMGKSDWLKPLGLDQDPQQGGRPQKIGIRKAKQLHPNPKK